MNKTLKLSNIDNYLLFGAGKLLIEIALRLQQRGLDVFIYTAPRQLADTLDEHGNTFRDLLQENDLQFESTDDINSTASLYAKITATTLGVGFGEAWSFCPDIIGKFEGRLLDYMGIPLPRYRGGAHYTWALLNNERNWGCHFQVINDEMVQGEFDSGELVFSDNYTIPKSIVTPADFFDFAVDAEQNFAFKFFDLIVQGHEFSLSLPDESASLFLPRLHTLKNGWLNWQWTGLQIEQFINAFGAPYAGASTRLNSEVVQLKGCRRIASSAFHPFESGLITRIQNNKVIVIVYDGLLEIEYVLQNGEPINSSLKTGMRLFTPMADIEAAMTEQISYAPSGLNNKTETLPDSDVASQVGSEPDSVPSSALDSDSKPQPKLESERLYFRALTRDDCNENYLSWLNNPQINQYLETRFFEQSIASIEEFVAGINNDPHSFLYGIFTKEHHQHIGNIKLGPINPRHLYADVSYFIGEPTSWGKGYATEAINRICQFGFHQQNLETIQAGVYGNNIGSVRALEKCGFELQGNIKNQLQGPNGREDHLWFSKGK